VLLGRDSECAIVERMLSDARSGTPRGDGRVLIIRGEPGIGKSALLDHAASSAEGMCVLRATGIESEAELEFAALTQLCRPLVRFVDGLPDPQAVVLRGAMCIGPAAARDRLAIGVAVLGLLAAAAEEQPLLLVLDDAQWLDRSSLDALLFACRRLVGDRIAVLIAARDSQADTPGPLGFPELLLSGLGPDVVRALVIGGSGRRVTPEVAERVWSATGGNPLAVSELAHVLSAAQLAGAVPFDQPVALGPVLEGALARRVEKLPAETRRALLVLAVSGSAKMEPLTHALRLVGLDTAALETAEDTGLAELADGSARFRHPLMRSVVYQLARPSERRAAHRAIADALAAAGDRRGCAWHLASAALGPDENAASALEEVAWTAQTRSGYAAAAAAWQRSATLSSDQDSRSRRCFEAARATWYAGLPRPALNLLDEALSVTGDTHSRRIDILHLRGHIEHLTGPVMDAYRSLLAAAVLPEVHDRTRAAEILLDAVDASMYAADSPALLAAAERARELAATDGGIVDLVADARLGQALLYTGRWERGRQHLDRAASLLRDRHDVLPDPFVLPRVAVSLSWFERHDEVRALIDQAVDRARAEGAAAALAQALERQAFVSLRAGQWLGASAAASEAEMLGRETGQTTQTAVCLAELAWVDAARGDDQACRRHTNEAVRLADTYGLGLVTLWARYVLALLDLGAGRPEPAAERLQAVVAECLRRRWLDPDMIPEPDLIEAYLMLGRRDDAVAAFDGFVAARGGALLPRVEALTARSAAMLAGDSGYRPAFEAALEAHARSGDPFLRARTELLYGERLRRSGQRVDARLRLRSALDTFDNLHAAPWASRARTELRATGVTVRRRSSPADGLTPQELQVAVHVAAGKTNREVGATLFLSHKTVEYHLGNAFRKLGVRSRTQLIRQLGDSPASGD
jgi:DNA-binding CsgD family transcriptional regulator